MPSIEVVFKTNVLSNEGKRGYSKRLMLMLKSIELQLDVYTRNPFTSQYNTLMYRANTDVSQVSHHTMLRKHSQTNKHFNKQKFGSNGVTVGECAEANKSLKSHVVFRYESSLKPLSFRLS